MADKKYSKEDVLKAWEQDDKVGQLDLVEVDTPNGKQTQILEKTNGSLVVAVDGTGSDAYQRLAENVRNPFIDGGETPTKQIETDEPRRTSEGVLATPTDPTSQVAAEPTRHFVGGQEVSEEEAEAFRKEQAGDSKAKE